MHFRRGVNCVKDLRNGKCKKTGVCMEREIERERENTLLHKDKAFSRSLHFYRAVPERQLLLLIVFIWRLFSALENCALVACNSK